MAITTVWMAAIAVRAHGENLQPAARFGATACRADLVRQETSRAPALANRALPTMPAARAVAQVTRSEKADVTFEVRPSPAGGVEVSGQSGQLAVKKTVQGSGEFVLELSTDRDRVTIGVSGQGTTVARGKTTFEQRRSAAAPDTGDRIRRLLADSPAVLRFRAVTAALLDADDRSPASMAFLIADAMVGMLTGDVGAPRRIARFLARDGLARVRAAGMAIDCYTLMEQRMVEAWGDYNGCWVSVSPSGFFQELCAARWVVQVESYWFGFLSCSGFNW